jgi:hypothetical protein
LQNEAVPFMVDASKKYLFGKKSFGRLEHPPIWVHDIEVWMQALESTPRDVPKIMNIHDHFLRIFKSLGPSDLHEARWIRPMPEDMRNALNKIVLPINPTRAEQTQIADAITRRGNTLKKIMPEAWGWQRSVMWQRMERLGGEVRPNSLFAPEFRGRKDNGEPDATHAPGILVEGTNIPNFNIDATLSRLNLALVTLRSTEARARGVDRYTPDLDSMSPVFKESMQNSNTGFGAGPSGTTGTLLQSAKTFTELEGEELKIYIFACVAYLVGGGMHTCHEVFTTGRLLGLPYTDGAYSDTLPSAFKSKQEYVNWADEFHDITV